VEEAEEKAEDRGDEGVGGGGFRDVGVVVREEIRGRREMDKRQ
jgi:hypothetical protein